MPDELLDQIAAAWSLPEPYTVRPLAGGTNNAVRLIETPTDRFVLRIYSNHADASHLRFEHMVLAHLQAAHLSFGLPVPVPTASGDTFLRVVDRTGESLAALTPYLPGSPPIRSDLAQARAGGEALGLLDSALASLPPISEDSGVGWRSDGDLARCHPLVPDPRAALLDLPIATALRDRLARSYDALVERIPSLYVRLPRQLVHEDFDPGNLLVEGMRVTGVLDFEFCSRDVRVMDLTVALSWWPVGQFGTGDEWPIIRAVAEGYACHIRLAEEEIQALPTLFQFRAFTSLIHRLGRYRQGLSPLEAVTARAVAALEREDWLRTNATKLMATVLLCMDTER